MTELYGGVETGGTWCVCALGAGPGELVDREQFPTTSPSETLEQIIEFFASRPRAKAIGVGAFGPVVVARDSPDWGQVTTTPKPNWQHTPVATVIEDRLGVPVSFDTDVGAAALGEQRWGAGRGLASVCYLTIGTGLGAGLVIDGHPWHGLVHPEVGHLRIPHDRDRDPFAGSCPVHGDCWEGLASGEAMQRRWGIAPEELEDDHRAWALEAEYVALGIFSIVSVVSPHRVIVGGGLAQRAQLLETVRARLPELNAGYLETPLLGQEIDSYIVAPVLGDDAGVLGAIALAQMENERASGAG
ncbi:MAG: ROK family protein [Solirubrobacteraceae bacterium]